MKKAAFDELFLKPIAYVRSDFKEKFGVPRQSGRVPLSAEIVFCEPYAVKEALRGIEGFSHLWILWGFSHNRTKGWSPTVRPPRLGGNRRMGVFATRSPNRPNPIGISCVRLSGVRSSENGLSLLVEGADMIDKTPVYDVKPYLRYADSIPDAVDGFAEEFEDYALTVDFPPELLEIIPADKRAGLIGSLSDDPRPSYRGDSRSYGMSFAGFEISFFVESEKILHVTGVSRSKKQ